MVAPALVIGLLTCILSHTLAIAVKRHRTHVFEIPLQDIYLSGSTLYTLGRSEISILALHDEKEVSYAVPEKVLLSTTSKIFGDKEKIVVTGKDSVHIAYLNFFNFHDIWTDSSTLKGPKDSRFGGAVAVSGGTLMVSQVATNQVFVYTFVPSTVQWSLIQTIAGPPDGMGNSLAMDGDLALVGSFNKHVVYCYQRHSDGRWYFHSTILAPHQSTLFGQSVALSGHIAVISDADGVYLFKWLDDGWQYQSDVLGLVSGVSSLSVSGDVLMILTSPTTIEVFTLNDEKAVAGTTASTAKSGSSRLRTAANTHF